MVMKLMMMIDTEQSLCCAFFSFLKCLAHLNELDCISLCTLCRVDYGNFMHHRSNKQSNKIPANELPTEKSC